MTAKNEIKAAAIWNEAKVEGLKQFIKSNAAKLSQEERIEIEMQSVQYRLEDYISSNDTTVKISVLDFVKMYLKTVGASQKRLASLFEMQDSNLHKYLTGERKLNASMVLKLSAFSGLDPELWIRLEAKNELLDIGKETGRIESYKKYHYHHLLVAEPDIQ